MLHVYYGTLRAAQEYARTHQLRTRDVLVPAVARRRLRGYIGPIRTITDPGWQPGPSDVLAARDTDDAIRWVRASSPTSPDCRAGKHDVCNDDAWNEYTDQPAQCACECHDHEESHDG